jgi:heme/copper-type cytochrome/quinol oxidase subunit 2
VTHREIREFREKRTTGRFGRSGRRAFVFLPELSALPVIFFSLISVISLISLCVSRPQAAQEPGPNRRDVTLLAHESHFEPNRIEVSQDDLVRITLTSDGPARSFAIDAYRISKRVGTKSTIVFEFRAAQPGTFSFYCDMTSVPACREMKGTLVVNPK